MVQKLTPLTQGEELLLIQGSVTHHFMQELSGIMADVASGGGVADSAVLLEVGASSFHHGDADLELASNTVAAAERPVKVAQRTKAHHDQG